MSEMTPEEKLDKLMELSPDQVLHGLIFDLRGIMGALAPGIELLREDTQLRELKLQDSDMMIGELLDWLDTRSKRAAALLDDANTYVWEYRKRQSQPTPNNE